jgi:3D (Asp-Asp-Asp) domain-containing protein
MDYLIIICLLFIFTGVKPASEVKATVYHIRGLTASGEHTDKIGEPFIAVSRDLLTDYPMHSKVRVFDCPHEGVYLIKDKMNKRFTKKIDVFIRYNGKKYNLCTCKMQIIVSPKDSMYYDETIIIHQDTLQEKARLDSVRVDSLGNGGK